MNAVLTKFYTLLWNDESCREIFFHHKEQLLEKETINLTRRNRSFYYQRIVLSNSLRRKRPYQRLLQRIDNRNIDMQKGIEETISKNLDESKIEKYLQQKFHKPITSITKMLNGSNISQIRFLSNLTSSFASEKRLLKFLKKYDFISESISSLDELVELITEGLEIELDKVLESKHLAEALYGMDRVASLYSNQVFESLMEANEIYTDLLYDTENYSDRLDLFDDLFEMGVLIGGKYLTYYECTNCTEGIFSGNMTQNIKPSKIRLNCPN